MYGMLGYCMLCWLVGLAFAWAFSRSANEDYASLFRAMGRVQRAAVHALVVVLSPLWLPLAVLWFVFQMARCVRNGRQALRAAQQYREPLFEPVNFFHLDKRIARTFADYTPAFLQVGFDLLGDYHNKPQPVDVYNRYFLGIKGTVFGDLTALLETCAAGFFSILEDGTYVETAAADPVEGDYEPTDEDQLRLVYAGEQPVDEVLKLHALAVCEEALRRGVGVLSFAPDQLQDVSIYGQRKFWSWRERCGDPTGPVPAPVLPRGAAVAPSKLDIDADALTNLVVTESK